VTKTRGSGETNQSQPLHREEGTLWKLLEEAKFYQIQPLVDCVKVWRCGVRVRVRVRVRAPLRFGSSRYNGHLSRTVQDKLGMRYVWYADWQQVCSSTEKFYQSPIFIVGGWPWRLSLVRDEGWLGISLTVSKRARQLPKGWRMNASFAVDIKNVHARFLHTLSLSLSHACCVEELCSHRFISPPSVSTTGGPEEGERVDAAL
jgi:hypothetical protein